MIGSWLIAAGYAEPEMRNSVRDEDRFYSADDVEEFVVVERRQRGR